MPALAAYVAAIFGYDILSEISYSLQTVVESQVRASSPVILSSIHGLDASYRVDSLVSQGNVQCASVALGSVEGFPMAERAISQAARQGSWVLLKNCHVGRHRLRSSL